MSEKKKLTNADLQAKIAHSIVFVPKDKLTQRVFFADRVLELTCTSDSTVIGTATHKHVFNNFTPSGYSKPYIYTKHFIDIAMENEDGMKATDAKGNVYYSFEKLIKCLEEKEDKAAYQIALFYSWYLYNIFQPLYSLGYSLDKLSDLGADNFSQFKVWYEYASNIALNSIALDENRDGMTNKQFYEKWKEKMDVFIKDQPESVLFEKPTEEQLAQGEIDAMAQKESEEAVVPPIKVASKRGKKVSK